MFEARDGTRVEREYPVGKAPQLGRAIRVKGRIYRRIYVTAPVHVSGFAMGRRASVSHQLPTYYGFRDSDAVWKRHLARMGLDDSKQTRRFAREVGAPPKPVQFEAEARRNAERAGALDKFDKKGRPRASTLREVHGHVARGRNLGDELGWD